MENQPQQTTNNAKRTKILIAILVALIAIGGSAGLIYLNITSGRIYVEKSQISAPQIDLAPQTPGALQETYVQAGDAVQANAPVARVGDELIKAKVGGTIISINNNIGKIFNPGETVVSMIDPQELKVIGQIEEDKGLKDLRVGQRAMFTVDAFGSKQYYGTVDEVSPTSRNSDIVFSISDKRQLSEFNTEIRFNVDQYPELKNGMSAKLWIYK
jgi:multidrug resistance efflux pump